MEDLGLEVHDAGLSPLDHQCAAITALAPEVLYCSPSILASLIAALERRGQRPASVRRIITNGEVLFPSARAHAQRFFGIGEAELMDTYGSTEIGTIAHSCGRCGGFHFLGGLYPEAAPAEVADPGDQAGRRPGTVVLAVSSLKRTSFPVVRFITYDVVRGCAATSAGAGSGSASTGSSAAATTSSTTASCSPPTTWATSSDAASPARGGSRSTPETTSRSSSRGPSPTASGRSCAAASRSTPA